MLSLLELLVRLRVRVELCTLAAKACRRLLSLTFLAAMLMAASSVMASVVCWAARLAAACCRLGDGQRGPGKGCLTREGNENSLAASDRRRRPNCGGGFDDLFLRISGPTLAKTPPDAMASTQRPLRRLKAQRGRATNAASHRGLRINAPACYTGRGRQT